MTYPLEQRPQAKEIDYPMLRQFDQALRPPRPFAAIEAPPGQVDMPWRTNRQTQDEEAQYSSVTQAAPPSQGGSRFDQNEMRGLISQRLDNLSMRVKRDDTLETISESGTIESRDPSVLSLLERLRDMRNQISGAVGILGMNDAPQDGFPLVKADPEAALRQELAAWNQLEERIEREILHPPRRIEAKAKTPRIPENSEPTRPIDIPSRKSSNSTVSPSASPLNSWAPSPSLSKSSPVLRPRWISTSFSSSSRPRAQSPLLEYEFPVHL